MYTVCVGVETEYCSNIDTSKLELMWHRLRGRRNRVLVLPSGVNVMYTVCVSSNIDTSKLELM